MSRSTEIRISARSGAVLLDLDGTLADTDPLHAQAWRDVAQCRFGVTVTWEDYRQACLVEGITPADLLTRLGVAAESAHDHEIAEEKAHVFSALVAEGLAGRRGLPSFGQRADAGHSDRGPQPGR